MTIAPLLLTILLLVVAAALLFRFRSGADAEPAIVEQPTCDTAFPSMRETLERRLREGNDPRF